MIGYNAADLCISIWLIGPITDRYISMEPPPAALDAGQLEGDPPLHGPQVMDPSGTVRELDVSEELSHAPQEQSAQSSKPCSSTRHDALHRA